MPPEPSRFQSLSFKSVLMPQIEIAERVSERGGGVNRLLSRQKKKKKKKKKKQKKQKKKKKKKKL